MSHETEQHSEYHAPWEKTFDRITSPFEAFIHNQAASGILLMLCAVVAMVLANSAAASGYFHFLHTEVGFTFGNWELKKTLHHWINDGLMALFFFVVGLEIKREVLAGELSDPRQAALPIIAALGGMVAPAAIYAAINHSGEGIQGWGIPMATDIAFAVGVLVLLGSRIPKALLTFLLALAIVDDLGAVLVIALFYTDTIVMEALGLAVLFLAILIMLNMAGVRKPLPYFIVGLLLWLAMLKSGIHATLAGVITALTIPARPKFDPEVFSGHVRRLMDKFDASHQPGIGIIQNETQKSILLTLEHGVHKVETPLQRLEHTFHLPVAFLVIPIFALANAGVPIEFATMGDAISHPVTMGVMLGLIAGKVVGVSGFTWVAAKMGICSLPSGVTFLHIFGVSLLAGIGFTMSIFIAELAFNGHPEMLLMAKTGILFASLVAGILGYLCLYLLGGKQKQS